MTGDFPHSWDGFTFASLGVIVVPPASPGVGRRTGRPVGLLGDKFR